ncbi:hypothetical protein TIFTF001_055840, partial [Ficus carica]
MHGNSRRKIRVRRPQELAPPWGGEVGFASTWDVAEWLREALGRGCGGATGDDAAAADLARRRLWWCDGGRRCCCRSHSPSAGGCDLATVAVMVGGFPPARRRGVGALGNGTPFLSFGSIRPWLDHRRRVVRPSPSQSTADVHPRSYGRFATEPEPPEGS